MEQRPKVVLYEPELQGFATLFGLLNRARRLCLDAFQFKEVCIG
jgi:hypothetical protein